MTDKLYLNRTGGKRKILTQILRETTTYQMVFLILGASLYITGLL